MQRIIFILSFLIVSVSCRSQLTDSSKPATNKQEPKKIHHIIMYGQSLMLGTGSKPLITTVQRYNTIMFKGGVRSGYDEPVASFYDGFAPLIEKESVSPASGTTLAETPASGFSDEFLGLLISENDWTFDTGSQTFEGKNERWLISAPAQGSCSAEDLSYPGEYWERFKKDILHGFALAIKEGMVYDVPVIIWNQGERDIDNRTDPEVYKTQLIKLRTTADQFIRSVTGQKQAVKLLIYQTSSFNVRKKDLGNAAISNAQYELAKSDPDITMSNATYQLPYLKDNVHFTNVASRWNGAMHGVAAKRLLMDHQNWRPVYVSSLSVKGNVLSISFVVPVPPLVLDETAVTNPGNYGFRLFDAAGREKTIRNIKLTGSSTLAITSTDKIAKGDYIWYGKNGSTTGAVLGARGNLRDSQGDKIKIDINSGSYRIDNWAPIFKETIR